MKRIEIQLSEPLEQVLASVLTLPSTLAEIDEGLCAGATDLELSQSGRCDLEVKEAVRSLYEAAHGRQVETPIGFLPIAPPIAGFLKDKPYYVATQYEFFLEAFARILVGGSPARKGQTNGAWTRRSKLLASHRGINVPENHPRGANGRVRLRSTTTRSQQPTIHHD
jgi:hypothetical protein